MNPNQETLTLGQVYERGAQEVPDKTAVVCGQERLTYRALNDRVDALAAGLAELGIRKGDRVAVYMKSSVELVADPLRLARDEGVWSRGTPTGTFEATAGPRT